ncbi:MAG TPA: hypothetical protein VLH94_03770 [Spirochaetia bacterium]|nr:hypothetical protein [Spirochaetia bacterium]
MDIKMIDLDKENQESPVINNNEKTVPSSFTVETPPKMKRKSFIPVIIVFLIVAVAGFYTGSWLKAKNSGTIVSAELTGIQSAIPETGVKVGDIFGSPDEKSFKDPATGVIDKGGFNGEGSHKLVRAGGVSQTVYLTSSTIDLDLLIGHQVTIWGETFKGQKVGWLMDVGRAKVEALNASLPE